jgi:hypothetical protein
MLLIQVLQDAPSKDFARNSGLSMIHGIAVTLQKGVAVCNYWEVPPDGPQIMIGESRFDPRVPKSVHAPQADRTATRRRDARLQLRHEIKEQKWAIGPYLSNPGLP